MAKRVGIVVACVVCALAIVVPNAASAQVIFNPQVGVNLSRLSSDPGGPDDFSRASRTGWLAGFMLRLGDETYLQPGLFWIREGSKLTGHPQPLEQGFIEASTDWQGLYIPVSIGFNLTGREHEAGYGIEQEPGTETRYGSEGEGEPAPLVLRANVGGSATLLTSVSNNDFSLQKGDFEKTFWAVRLGVGVDISILTFDAAYDIGVSRVLKNFSTAKNNMLTFSAGLKFE